jgi:hypothetical protein
MKRIALLALLLFAVSCRTINPVRDITPVSAPDISRLMLLSGKVVEFNDDFGWYNKQAGTIEGVTRDSQQVVYHLSEIGKVETVRTYSIAIAVLTALVPLAVGVYLLARLLSLFRIL